MTARDSGGWVYERGEIGLEVGLVGSAMDWRLWLFVGL